MKAPQRQVTSENPMKTVGDYVRELRTKAGISQLMLSRRLGYDYYNFIASVENGRSKIPLDSVGRWGKALDVDSTAFARKVLSIYEPDLYTSILSSSE